MVSSRQNIRETGWIDYVLSATLGALALFCCGQGIAQPVSGWILIGLYSVGTAFSFIVGTKLRQTRFAAFDGPLYAAAAGVAVFGQGVLNQFLPAETFPPELRSAGWLAWILCLGSFAGWRDATRLFQTVPALALFGLIGIYDTYPPAPFLFFGFLLCLALMFGRAHARAMLLQASRSGFSRVEEGLSLSEAGADQDSMLRAMRRGPWRWMAGPEWAVASAGAVILVSIFGAPIIKDEVQGISGMVRFNLPKRLRDQTQNAQAPPLSANDLQRLGLGPRRLSPTVVGVAELDHSRYLRTAIYKLYIPESGSGRGWDIDHSQFQPATPDSIVSQISNLDRPRHFHFEVSMTDARWAQQMPAPAGVEAVTDPPGADIRADGTVNAGGETSIQGTSAESTIALNEKSPAANLASRGAKFTASTTPAVRNLALAASAGKKTDYDKAMAIMSAITQHAKYNLQAAAIPSGKDPVDYFLFESHEGYCDLFASAMVVLARNANLDAQYVTGYLTRTDDRDADGRYILRQEDAHSWAEIYFQGLGWIVFDPTSQAEDITPKDQSDIARLAMTWVPVAGIVAVLSGIVYYVPRMRLRLRMPVAIKRQRKLERLYGSFASAIGRVAKMRKPASSTPGSWIEMVRPKLGRITGAALALNAKFERALYSSDPSTEEQLSDLKNALREFKRAKR